MNEESKKAGNAENQNPLASSSGTTIRSLPHLPHTKRRWGGGALLSCFPTLSPLLHGRLAKPRLLINQENRRGRREAD